MTAHDAGDDSSTASSDAATTRTAPSYVWKSAYGALVAMVVTVPLGVGFFLYQGVFALLSDAAALVVGLFLAPLVWGLYLLNERDPLDRAVFGVGVISVAAICVGSLGLVVAYLFELPQETYGSTFLGIQFLGWILVGVWLLGVGVLGRRTGTIETRTAWTAMVAGAATAGGMVSLIYSYAVGSFTLLFPILMAIFLVGFLLWAFWLGGDLRARAAAGE